MPSDALLRIDGVSKTYEWRQWLRRALPGVRALDDVSLSVPSGITMGLVGRSGSGKSTLARCIVCRERPTSGTIRYAGCDVHALEGAERRQFLRAVQLIPQDPGASLNPVLPAWRIVSEPIALARSAGRKKCRERAIELMSLVALHESAADWPSAQFSGGQRARLALARALACEPKVLILDESLANLDLSIQAQVINLLLDLQTRLGLTYFVTSHDLGMVGYFADQVAVFDGGRIVEQGTPAELFRRPKHPATQSAVAAAPNLHWAAAG